MELNNKTFILNNKGLKAFLLFYFAFVFVGIMVFFLTKHGDIVLWMNGLSKEEWDGFVNFLTDLGLGSFVAALMAALVFLRIRYAIMGLLNLGLVGLFTSLFKKGLFPERTRPFNYFYYDDFHRFIHAAELNYHSSFPSGHTMTIFAAMSLIAYFIGGKTWGVVLFFVALIIGFTRIYLLQHFFLDVYVGSILGLICTFIVVWLLDQKLHLNERELFNKPIYRISFKKS